MQTDGPSFHWGLKMLTAVIVFNLNSGLKQFSWRLPNKKLSKIVIIFFWEEKNRRHNAIKMFAKASTKTGENVEYFRIIHILCWKYMKKLEILLIF